MTGFAPGVVGRYSAGTTGGTEGLLHGYYTGTTGVPWGNEGVLRGQLRGVGLQGYYAVLEGH